jgi:hypothetical protein
MARRFGSAMISNTDSIPWIYPTTYIHVKAYKKKKSNAFRTGRSHDV